jgi:uncharacterized protein YndB with AHSA1/START domain
LATNTIHIDAGRQDVYAVLSDGWRYTTWVVGTSHMMAVQADWPAKGTKLFHAVGAWPFMIRDQTEVLGVEPGRRLELLAHGRPLGDAQIVLELEDDDGGCRLTMHEEPVNGPGKWVNNRMGEALLHRRNSESLSRLRALAERRTEPGDG